MKAIIGLLGVSFGVGMFLQHYIHIQPAAKKAEIVRSLKILLTPLSDQSITVN